MLKKFLLIIFLFSFSLTTYSQQFDTVVTFGDSLSDDGNLYKYLLHIIPISPPYYKGRFSNGPLWIEKLYEDYFPHGDPEKFINFAVGGAGAVIAKKENLPFSLWAEINNYIYYYQYAKRDKSLFVVWIGGNNYMKGPENVNEITSSVVNAIGDGIEKLIGMKASMFLIINLPDMELTPEGRDYDNPKLLKELTSKHNLKLLSKYNALKKKYPQVEFAYLDVNTTFKDLTKHPQQYGFTNIKNPCYNGGYFFGSKQSSNQVNLETYLTQQIDDKNLNLNKDSRDYILSSPVLREALRVGYQSSNSLRMEGSLDRSCPGYFFWDHVHPTTAVHRLVAEFAKSALEDAGIYPTGQSIKGIN